MLIEFRIILSGDGQNDETVLNNYETHTCAQPLILLENPNTIKNNLPNVILGAILNFLWTEDRVDGCVNLLYT